MKYILYFLLLLPFSEIYSQQLIAGIIRDTAQQEITGVRVSQAQSYNFHYSDFNGAFHIVMDTIHEQSLWFEHPNFHPFSIPYADTISSPLNIVLEKSDSTVYIRPPNYRRGYNDIGGVFMIQADLFEHDFQQFEPLLGQENIEILNQPAGILSLELALVNKRHYFGFFLGFLSTQNRDPDSIDIKLNYSIAGLNYGFRVLDTKRFLLMPTLSYRQYAYRLFNSATDDKIPLDQYVQEKEVDLRFTQSVLFLGGTIAFKFRGKQTPADEYFTFGGYSGYNLKLQKKPGISSKQKQVTTDQKIDLKNVSFGIFLSMNFE